MMPVRPEPEPRLQLATARHFALAGIGSRLASEPDLVAAFWSRIGAPTNPDHPDLTVIYSSVRRFGETFTLLEFVAGETLEEFIRRSDPASCEQEIPLFCRLLDAFEGGAPKRPDEAVSERGLELIDFGVGRALASVASKLHGAVLIGPDGACSEQMFGEYGANRSEARALLMELCARLPGNLPRTSAYGPANLGECAVCSLATPVLPSEPAPPIAAPPVTNGWLARTVASPFVIAVATAMLVLITLYAVSGFLAKRNAPSSAGKLTLPPFSPVAEAPVEIAPQAQLLPDAPPPLVIHAPSKRRSAREPVTSIVLARGARPIRQTSLQYPAEAKREHISGTVEMEVTIAEDGSVQSPRVLSGDPLLRAGLAEEISKWVYQPLRINGKPVPMTTELAIKFNLTP